MPSDLGVTRDYLVTVAFLRAMKYTAAAMISRAPIPYRIVSPISACGGHGAISSDGHGHGGGQLVVAFRSLGFDQGVCSSSQTSEVRVAGSDNGTAFAADFAVNQVVSTVAGGEVQSGSVGIAQFEFSASQVIAFSVFLVDVEAEALGINSHRSGLVVVVVQIRGIGILGIFGSGIQHLGGVGNHNILAYRRSCATNRPESMSRG